MKNNVKLETRVMKYIKNNVNGVSLSDMEAPLVENRMKLGFIIKKLLRDEKISRVNNLYFFKNDTTTK